MKNLVGNQNEMNYKVLFESVMDRIAKLEQELATLKNNEPTDATQVIREQIVDLLDTDDSDEVILALLPVLETNNEYNYYLPHDKDSLEYLFENVFRNNLMAFTNWVASDDYLKSSYLNIYNGQIICVDSLEVYGDLRCYVQDCPDEVLDEMIAVLDELQLW
jgi:hypothetical protein